MIQTQDKSSIVKYCVLFFLVLLMLLMAAATSCQRERDFSGEDRVALHGKKMSVLQKKAEQGDINAQAILGFMYYKGNDVEQDYREAYQWFKKAAEQGSAFAQLGLGTMYSAGVGVAQDDAQATKWYRKAAEQGSVGCQYRLGTMYAEGKGVEQCNVQAYKWLSLAAMKGITQAATLRDRLAKEMTPPQIAEGKALTRKWIESHGQ